MPGKVKMTPTKAAKPTVAKKGQVVKGGKPVVTKTGTPGQGGKGTVPPFAKAAKSPLKKKK
jgi:hypothetical protein